MSTGRRVWWALVSVFDTIERYELTICTFRQRNGSGFIAADDKLEGRGPHILNKLSIQYVDVEHQLSIGADDDFFQGATKLIESGVSSRWDWTREMPAVGASGGSGRGCGAHRNGVSTCPVCHSRGVTIGMGPCMLTLRENPCLHHGA